MIGKFLIGLGLLFVGEGIFQIGLVLPWLWLMAETLVENNKTTNRELFYTQIGVVGLGIAASIVTGTILGGFSVYWIICLWCFWYLNRMFAEPNVFLVIILIEVINLIGDMVIGTKWGFMETIILAVETGLLFRFSHNQFGVRLRRSND